MAILAKLIATIQQSLFPALEAELAAPLGEKGELFVTVVELVRPERFSARFEGAGLSCPRQWRLPVLLAFIAKAVWNFPTTRALLDRLAHDGALRRLCGWERAADVPSEATSSHAFAPSCWATPATTQPPSPRARSRPGKSSPRPSPWRCSPGARWQRTWPS